MKNGSFYFSFSFYNPIMLTTQNVWLVSSNAEGPWTPAQLVPAKATAIVCSPTSTDPLKPRQLCTLPWSDSHRHVEVFSCTDRRIQLI